MTHEFSWTAVGIFGVFVALTLGISFWFAARARSAKGYFAAHGQIHWFVNGIAFAGDYLSAASFLGICGMIAFYGYDGFLYSIGYLAGWIVALFVIAEPLKRMGKYTFADALDSQFQSRGIKLAVAISTLAVSIFYLIPQMVGAGALIQPILSFPENMGVRPHDVGVLLVGTVVIIIVTTAGMVSTTYVQFFKGSLLVAFSLLLTILILNRGLSTNPTGEDKAQRQERIRGPFPAAGFSMQTPEGLGFSNSRIVVPKVDWLDKSDLPALGVSTVGLLNSPNGHGCLLASSALYPGRGDKPYLHIENQQTGRLSVWRIQPASATEGVRDSESVLLLRAQMSGEGESELRPVGRVLKLPDETKGNTGPLNPFSYLSTIQKSEILLWRNEKINEADGSTTTVYYPVPTSGDKILSAGNHPNFKGIRSGSFIDKLNFLSLMLALFCGTASLPHILIRYFTVKDEASARKSTVVGIGSIGFFYVLTLFLGLGAMTSGAMDVSNTNMAAPLLARTFGEWMFAIISAIAFTTVLGTVSGLIVAASGAVAHDLAEGFLKLDVSDTGKVRIGKITAVGVGVIAIALGILFQNMNVSYLVGWAFSVAASANLPALVMLLFWRGTTRQGIIAAVVVGMVSSLAWILLSADTFQKVYGLPAESALAPFSQPGIVTIPLGFATLIVVSLLTRKHAANNSLNV